MRKLVRPKLVIAISCQLVCLSSDSPVALLRRLPFVIFLLVLLITALAVYIDWTWKRKLAPRSGRYFIHRVELAVPSFRSPMKNGATIRWAGSQSTAPLDAQLTRPAFRLAMPTATD
jgi:hypothetical protein